MSTVTAVKNRILQLTKERNITINKLANISALPPSSVKAIVYGWSKNPKILTIKMMCDGLEITLAEFFNTPEFNNGEELKIKKTDSNKTEESEYNTLTAIRYRILQLCDENDIPIYRLVERTGVSTGSVNNILYGKSKNPKLMTIKMLCDGFGITLAEFFDTDEFNYLEQEIR